MNRVKPSTFLIIPNTGSTVCWRNRYFSRPDSLSSFACIASAQALRARLGLLRLPSGDESHSDVGAPRPPSTPAPRYDCLERPRASTRSTSAWFAIAVVSHHRVQGDPAHRVSLRYRPPARWRHWRIDSLEPPTPADSPRRPPPIARCSSGDTHGAWILRINPLSGSVRFVCPPPPGVSSGGFIFLPLRFPGATLALLTPYAHTLRVHSQRAPWPASPSAYTPHPAAQCQLLPARQPLGQRLTIERPLRIGLLGLIHQLINVHPQLLHQLLRSVVAHTAMLDSHSHQPSSHRRSPAPPAPA